MNLAHGTYISVFGGSCKVFPATLLTGCRAIVSGKTAGGYWSKITKGESADSWITMDAFIIPGARSCSSTNIKASRILWANSLVALRRSSGVYICTTEEKLMASGVTTVSAQIGRAHV